jgi:hypothetical protein
MKVETDNLKTVASFAKIKKRNRSRIYQMLNDGSIDPVIIDGVIFIDQLKAKK